MIMALFHRSSGIFHGNLLLCTPLTTISYRLWGALFYIPLGIHRLPIDYQGNKGVIWSSLLKNGLFPKHIDVHCHNYQACTRHIRRCYALTKHILTYSYVYRGVIAPFSLLDVVILG